MFARAYAFFALVCLAAAGPDGGFTINYKAGDELSNTTITYDRDNHVITTFTPHGAHFAQVDSIEDYNVGFSATRLNADEACYIAKLDSSFKTQLAFYRSHKDEPITITSSQELKAIPAEDTEEYGERLNEFCGDYPVYKLGTYDTGLEEGATARQVFYTFYNCYCNGCTTVCYYTTITVPTGTNIVFFWFFG